MTSRENDLYNPLARIIQIQDGGRHEIPNGITMNLLLSRSITTIRYFYCCLDVEV